MKETMIQAFNWRSRRSALERGLTIIAICRVLTITASASPVSAMSSKVQNNDFENGSTNKDICLTSECVNTASKVLEYMNSNIEPCDDFYKFACGNFMKNSSIPDDKKSIDSFSLINEKLVEQLKIIIEEKVKPNEKKHFKLIKTFYENCINQTAINGKGLQPAKDILKKLGGWPVLSGDSWQDEDFEWKQSVKKFRQEGFQTDYFFLMAIGFNPKNKTKRILIVDQTSLGLFRDYLTKGLNNDNVKAYYDYMVDIAVIFGASRDNAEKELKESLEFEIKLANISLPREERRNPKTLYNPMTVRELQENYSSIPWKEYFNAILEPIIQIGDDEVVIVRVPSFFRDFEKLMEQTPKRVQANYVMWRAVAATIKYLNDDVRQRQMEFITFFNGQTKRVPRWKECIDSTNEYLRLSIGSLYVQKYFKEDAKKRAVQMVSNIRQEFQKILQTVDWMDEKTRKIALEKAKSIKSYIGYPEELLDDKKLEEYYKSLEITPGDYLESILNCERFNINEAIRKLRKSTNDADWTRHSIPTVVNAFYSPFDNSIKLAAGILQGTFYSKDIPHYMNYGAIGWVIGHEITHGFDDRGRHHDSRGNVVEWWQPKTEKKFLSKAECIVHQYGNYTDKVTNLNLNGKRTQGENIADNGGIKISYLAYREWVKQNGAEPKLPDLNYTPLQLFWISAAQAFCEKIRPESLKHYITSGDHVPDKFRVFGSFSNRPEFANDFNCPDGSAMKPKKKCSIW